MVIALFWGGKVCPLITPPVLALTVGLCGRPWGPLSGMELLEVTQVTTGYMHAQAQGCWSQWVLAASIQEPSPMPFAGRAVNSAKVCASINLFWRDPRPHSHSSLCPLGFQRQSSSTCCLYGLRLGPVLSSRGRGEPPLLVDESLQAGAWLP